MGEKNVTKRNVIITIKTARTQIDASLFEEIEDEFLDGEYEDESSETDGDEPSEMMIEGRLITGASRVELVYDESEGSGMGGSITTIGFDRVSPGLISMLRTGTVYSAFVFEEGKRHVSVYDTPFSSFDICVRTVRVKNTLLTEGRIELEYLIEVHGAQAERCRMEIGVRPAEGLFGKG